MLYVLVKRFGSAKQAFHEFQNEVIANGDDGLPNNGSGRISSVLLYFVCYSIAGGISKRKGRGESLPQCSRCRIGG